MKRIPSYSFSAAKFSANVKLTQALMASLDTAELELRIIAAGAVKCGHDSWLWTGTEDEFRLIVNQWLAKHTPTNGTSPAPSSSVASPLSSTTCPGQSSKENS